MQDKINKVHHAECLPFMEDIPDKYFNVIFLDQPFETTKNEWDKKIPQKPLWESLNRIIKDDGIIIAFSTQPFTTEVINGNIENFRYDIIWDKVLPVGFLNSGRMPLRSHEVMSIFYKKLPYYKPLMTQGHERKSVPKRNSVKQSNYGDFKEGTGYDSTERHPKSIIEIEDKSAESIINTLLERLSKYEPDTVMKFSNGGKRTTIIHPTEKPIELAKNLLRMYAKEGFKIFDPTAGSGVFLEAAKSLGLEYCGCEKYKDIHSKIEKRLEAVQGSLF